MPNLKTETIKKRDDREVLAINMTGEKIHEQII